MRNAVPLFINFFKKCQALFCLLFSLSGQEIGFSFCVIPMKMGIQYWYYQKTWIPAGVYPVLDTGQEQQAGKFSSFPDD